MHPDSEGVTEPGRPSTVKPTTITQLARTERTDPQDLSFHPLYPFVEKLDERVANLEWWRPVWGLLAGAAIAVVVMGMAAISGAMAAFLAQWVLG